MNWVSFYYFSDLAAICLISECVSILLPIYRFLWCPNMCAVMLILNFSRLQNTNTRESYLVFPTAILQRLFEVFFRSWLPGEVRADKQRRVRYHCRPWAWPGMVKVGLSPASWSNKRAMISDPHLTLGLGLRSTGWLGSYWPPCLPLFYLPRNFSRIDKG